MEEILIQLVQLFAEVLLEFAGEALLDLLVRATANLFKTKEPPNRVRTFFTYGFLGAIAGSASLVIFPHRIFHSSKFHGISLIVGPVLTGLGMSAVGAILRKYGKRVVQIETFPYAFAFAFGMALVRLVWAS
jgi:hypothetical protein